MKKKLFLTFIISISIVLISFLIFGIYPFGDTSIIVIDSDTQYISFISYLKTIFMGTNDFKYSFSLSLGGNFIPLLGYYLMSPFNLLTLLFSNQNMKIALTIIILIKIGLCGVSMQYYLNKKYNNKKTLLFSLCYALMSYNIVYMYHVMWLDSIILFPLIILGINYIFKNKSPLLYIITLALSIIFNYYFGIITCLTSLIYFLYKFILDYKIINKFKVIINYGVSSLFAGLSSMFIIIPTLIGLSSGKASFSLSNLKFSITTSYLRIIAKTFTASLGDGETWRGGPMISCGMIIVVLIILYFLNKKVPKRTKIINGLFLFFMASTFAVSALNILFHGLNIPNCFDYRHAFVFVFFMIYIAVESYNNLNLNKRDLMITTIILFILSILIYLSNFKFNTSTFNLTILLSFTISIIVIYILYKCKKMYKVIFIITIIDLLINVSAGVLMISTSDKQSMNEYKAYTKNTSMLVNKVSNYDNSFYRIEKTLQRSSKKNMLAINDSMTFNYSGISHFDSTDRTDVEKFLESLGFRMLTSRSYYNKNGSTKAADMLLGIKYVLSYYDYKDYEEVIDNVYKNPYNLSIGYKINDDTYSKTKNPFINMNNIIKSFTGLDKDVYTNEEYSIDTKNVDIEGNKYLSNAEGKIIYNIKITNSNVLYFYQEVNEDMNEFEDASLYVNDEYIGEYFSKYDWGVISLGKFEVGEVIQLRIEFKDKLKKHNSYFYYENDDILEEQYKILKGNELNLTKITSSHLKGTINLKEKSNILITLPYDTGFTVLVDGKNTKINKSLDIFLSFEIDKGEHDIEIIYNPKGLNLGLTISSVSVILITIYAIIKNKKSK